MLPICIVVMGILDSVPILVAGVAAVISVGLFLGTFVQMVNSISGNAVIRPQLQAILGTVFVGSLISVVMLYMILVQYGSSTKYVSMIISTFALVIGLLGISSIV